MTQPISRTESKKEIKFKGKAVSRGIGIGKVARLQGRKGRFYRSRILESQINRELRRFRAAVRLAKRQLRKLASNDATDVQSGIFEAQMLILEDRGFLTKIENLIREERINAEWAVREAANSYISLYKEFKDEVLRERYVDIEDIAERLISILGGRVFSLINIDSEVVLVTDELKPSTLVELGRKELKGIVCESGGWTSHAFIIARELGIPAVTNLKNFFRYVSDGETVVVDGYKGEVILHPSEETIKRLSKNAQENSWLSFEKTNVTDSTLKTLDGKEIKILVNLDFPEAYEKAKRYGVKGVGLYRSEFLFRQGEGFPTELEQLKAYKRVAELVGEDGIKIRTFDLNLEAFGEKFYEKNPALGLRAIRLSLTYEKLFRSQIRALLRASARRKIDIVLPMISDLSEILRAKEIIAQESERLSQKQISIGKPLLGVMIEVPSAIFIIDEILEEVDFINLGTNDLVQYLLAVDRDNESVADWFRTLHPAVIRAVEKVLRKANEKNVEVILCGEMAGSPVYVPILIGLGAVCLSMNINSIPKVRYIVSNIAYEEAFGIAQKILAAKSANEAEEIMRREFMKKWQNLFPPEVFVQK